MYYYLYIDVDNSRWKNWKNQITFNLYDLTSDTVDVLWRLCELTIVRLIKCICFKDIWWWLALYILQISCQSVITWQLLFWKEGNAEKKKQTNAGNWCFIGSSSGTSAVQHQLCLTIFIPLPRDFQSKNYIANPSTVIWKATITTPDISSQHFFQQ